MKENGWQEEGVLWPPPTSARCQNGDVQSNLASLVNTYDINTFACIEHSTRLRIICNLLRTQGVFQLKAATTTPLMIFVRWGPSVGKSWMYKPRSNREGVRSVTSMFPDRVGEVLRCQRGK